MELVERRRDVALVLAGHGLSERQACTLLKLDRTTYRSEPRPERNARLHQAMIELARQKPRYGYRRRQCSPDAIRNGRSTSSWTRWRGAGVSGC